MVSSAHGGGVHKRVAVDPEAVEEDVRRARKGLAEFPTASEVARHSGPSAYTAARFNAVLGIKVAEAAKATTRVRTDVTVNNEKIQAAVEAITAVDTGVREEAAVLAVSVDEIVKEPSSGAASTGDQSGIQSRRDDRS